MITDPDRVWVLLGKKKSGESTPAELQELTSLLESYHLAASVLDSVWRAPLKPSLPSGPGLITWNRINKRINHTQDKALYRQAIMRRWLVAASVVIIVSCIGLYYFTINPQPFQLSQTPLVKDNQFITPAGSKSRLELPDGTSVWLNGNSQLSYSHAAFGERLREIYLSGEAFFDVVKNAKIPFVIHTGPVTITVKGTAFNVKAYPGSKTIETSLVRGLIEITTRHDPDRKIILKPDEKIVIPVQDALGDSLGAAQQQPTDPSVYAITSLHKGKSAVLAETVWLQTRFEFDDEPFSELAPKMAEWFNISITLADEEIRAKRFTGAIEKETLKETLKAMQLSYPFIYTLKGNQLTIYKKNHSSS